jgi:hypothetical protein
MPKVFIVNYAGHDYTAAESWGELVPLTIGHVPQGSLDRLMYDITKLNDSGSEDWLLPSGLLILNVIASAFWMRKHKELRLLVRDRRNKTYREMKISSSHLDFLIKGAEQSEERKTSDGEDPN